MNRTNKTRLNIESLEVREVPATFSVLNGVLTITGTSGSDNLAATSGSSATSTVVVRDDSAGGNNQVLGTFSNINKVVFNGNAGSDGFHMYGAVKLVADGGTGNDSIYGGDGGDTIKGGIGDDWLVGYAGNDTIYGGDNNDYLAGGLGSDKLYGDAGVDNLYEWNLGAVPGADTNYLYGGAGADTLVGGVGIEYLYGGDASNNNDGAADSMTGNGSKDYFQPENYTLFGAPFNLDKPKDFVPGVDVMLPA